MKTGLFSFPTPFTPPTTEENDLCSLRLIRSPRIGAATFHRLVAEHGSAAAALAELPERARGAGLSGYSPCSESEARAELRAGHAAGARLIVAGDPLYPQNLAMLADAPPVLWALGNPALLAGPAVAVVGARAASSLGLRMARLLGRELGEAGLRVVSGLARGIDTAAHEASLPTGTIAVMAGGVDVVYPPENHALFQRLREIGLILSEQPWGLRPTAAHFPRRNRIVAGLSAGVVVVEAAPRSGSLITARLAAEQGREVMAVPGHPLDGRAGGCNALLRDGATLVRGAQDVLAALGPLAVAPPPPEDAHHDDAPATDTPPDNAPKTNDPAAAAPLRRRARVDYGPGADNAAPPNAAPPCPAGADTAPGPRILAHLGAAPVAEDQLARDLGLAPEALSVALLELELDGRIERQPGGLVARRG
ncbi:DNA-processing protein DprA [Phaeovulum vinaykumarii]|uniref:DNA processing protein n=1 Tax=Phaeovulum vinaykumarii TaxID=407234 RepID=A0A1N7MHH2_9RHOB|nr:DNA-processing protein DprA [Phaeovulum vinaykumarii]SIS85576.1 DNA processing protein [Phaeovulum vinaykumarii]SOC12281.1 DNA processing protein [Phaeovulum vinaykumarii]